MRGLDDHLDGYGDPGPTAYADTDPCPGAARFGQSAMWVHLHPVRCTVCDHLLVHVAWWGPGHQCGRCYRDGAMADA
jgi:hypothetical protein